MARFFRTDRLWLVVSSVPLDHWIDWIKKKIVEIKILITKMTNMEQYAADLGL